MLGLAGLLLRIIVAVILLASSWGKFSPGTVVNTQHLVRYRVLPRRVAGSVALVLPCIELSLGAALIVGFDLTWTLRACSALFAIFAVAMASALIRVGTTPCGCFGSLRSSDTSWVVVARNGILAAALGAVATQSRPSAADMFPGRWSAIGLICVFVLAAVWQLVVDSRIGRIPVPKEIYRSRRITTHYGST